MSLRTDLRRKLALSDYQRCPQREKKFKGCGKISTDRCFVPRGGRSFVLGAFLLHYLAVKEQTRR